MKTGLLILIMCAVLSLGLGCKKESEQVGRYQVFSASWEELYLHTDKSDGKVEPYAVTQKQLVKLDSVTGRVWVWSRGMRDTKDQSGWVEMTDSGLVLPPSLQGEKH